MGAKETFEKRVSFSNYNRFIKNKLLNYTIVDNQFGDVN